MKAFLPTLGIGVLVVVVGMVGWSLRAHAPGAEEDAEVTLRLSRIGRIANGQDATHSMFFDVYVGRTDLGLTEPDNPEGSILSTDLAPEQQVTWMEVEGGNVCEYHSIPHRCEISEGGTHTLSIQFADGGIATATLEVPEAPEAVFPSLIEPSTIPEQDSLLEFTFTDVGATSYNHALYFCHSYENDGINPCLDGYDFALFQTETGDWISYFTPEAVHVTSDPEQGTLTVTRDNATVIFGSSIIYHLCANTHGVRDDGVETFISACTSVEFVR